MAAPDAEEVDLGDLVRSVVASLAPAAPGPRCEILVTADGPVRGRWDRAGIEQVIRNLLTNAIAFGGGDRVEVRACAENDRRTAVLEVRDHGAGFKPADLARLFEPFPRAGDATGLARVGLGLYTVRRIVDAHGGVVLAVSQPGRGSTFIVNLPARRGPAA